MTSEYTWIENLTISGDNLSGYYVACALVSFIAVIFTWWTQRNVSSDNKITVERDPISSSLEESLAALKENSVDNSDSNIDESVKRLTKNERSALLEGVAQTLSNDQLEEEKEVEKQQLENIFELLKQQEEKFNVGSLEELQDQMKLYRG